MRQPSKTKAKLDPQAPEQDHPEQTSDLRIIRLRAENVKRLTAIDLHPGGQTVVLGGENGAGKTSVLDSIAYLLGGKSELPPMPLRRGEEKGSIEIDLGDLIARRTFTAGGGGTLTVRNREGAVYPSPQAILDKLVGDLSFDPLAFTRMSGREQAEMLRRLTGVDFADLDATRAEIYAARTEAGRELRAIEGQLAGNSEPTDDIPEVEISVAELTGNLFAAQRIAQENDLARRRAAEAMSTARVAGIAAETATTRVDQLRVALREAETAASTARMAYLTKHRDAEIAGKVANALIDPDLAPIEASLRGAEELNRRVRAAAQRRQLTAQAVDKRVEVDSLTAAIGEVDAEKEAMLAAAPFPVAGLGFDVEGGGVTLNGIPFEQASATEQLMVSLAMGAALNPRLRVLLVRDASLLTPKNRAVLLDWCERVGMQGWIEMAGESGEVTVVIEDGAVREGTSA